MCLNENLELFPKFSEQEKKSPFFHEKLARCAGYTLVAGVDEAGRGPLAGPVVASAVILPENAELPGVTDSKKMTERSRDRAFDLVRKTALGFSIGVVSAARIDEINILQASLEAMSRAIKTLDLKPDMVLVDGIHAVPLPIPQKCLKKGDQISRTVSAASVLAKVYRDRIMMSLDILYPCYGFARHKGYGTRQHLEALKNHGPCPIHRMTFKGVRSSDPGKT